jgi:hypothetical protein
MIASSEDLMIAASRPASSSAFKRLVAIEDIGPPDRAKAAGERAWSSAKTATAGKPRARPHRVGVSPG